ncbi:hypothetical protein M5W70_01365 [Paenibacillus larvae]|uniref:Uncharacterized protein n=2 Tax=Paenibacillus larvae TaxID=1464 RepID=A0AAP5N2E2_9BACL|nr:hypothetical protein [Paenibacillus larvae]MCY9687449.1 hypothetical protein [Paenibacillus larvae]MDT2251145.1 hypothetical protein [Paenibacillus larvae]MDV3484034.1 hypothetical protein [Paenibacillus larvae]
MEFNRLIFTVSQEDMIQDFKTYNLPEHLSLFRYYSVEVSKEQGDPQSIVDRLKQSPLLKRLILNRTLLNSTYQIQLPKWKIQRYSRNLIGILYLKNKGTCIPLLLVLTPPVFMGYTWWKWGGHYACRLCLIKSDFK